MSEFLPFFSLQISQEHFRSGGLLRIRSFILKAEQLLYSVPVSDFLPSSSALQLSVKNKTKPKNSTSVWACQT